MNTRLKSKMNGCFITMPNPKKVSIAIDKDKILNAFKVIDASTVSANIVYINLILDKAYNY